MIVSRSISICLLLAAALFFAGPTRAGEWREGAPLGVPKAFAASAIIGEEIYVIGGGGLSEPVSTVDVYDTIGDIWRTLPALPAGMEQAAAASVDGVLFVSGGLGQDISDGPLRELWIFDPAVGVWARGADMPQGRYGHTLMAYQGKLLAFGGTGGAQILSYDIAKDAWTVQGNMPDVRKGAAIAALGGKVYVAGGLDHSNRVSQRVDVFDLASSGWSIGPRLPEARAGASMTSLDGRLYLIGGQSLEPNRTYAEMFVFDPAAGRWTRGEPMSTPRHSAVSAGINGHLYVIGGGTGAGVFTLFTGTDLVEIYTP